MKSPRSPLAHSSGGVGDGHLSIDSFETLTTQEPLGSVDVVRHTATNKVYALKVVDKSETIRLDLIDDAETERSILVDLSTPWVVKLFDSFKDERRVYLLLDFVGGGSLHDHLSATGAFEDATAQYYTAQVTIALGAHASVVGIVVTRSRASVEALHEAKVAHGALSTEHVMLDVHGHVVLVSLAGAARFERVVVPPARRRARLQPHCAAPERFRNEPASAAADLWALGCLIYEMLTAVPLFLYDSAYATAEAVHDVDSAHLASKLEPAAARDLVRHLVVLDASKRDAASVRGSKWLRAIDWKALSSRSGRAPLMTAAAAMGESAICADVEKVPSRLPAVGAPQDIGNLAFGTF